MVQETVDLIGLKEEINKSKKDLTYLMDIFQQNEKLMNDSVGFKQFEEDISFLKKEITTGGQFYLWLFPFMAAIPYNSCSALSSQNTIQECKNRGEYRIALLHP